MPMDRTFAGNGRRSSRPSSLTLPRGNVLGLVAPQARGYGKSEATVLSIWGLREVILHMCSLAAEACLTNLSRPVFFRFRACLRVVRWQGMLWMLSKWLARILGLLASLGGESGPGGSRHGSGLIRGTACVARAATASARSEWCPIRRGRRTFERRFVERCEQAEETFPSDASQSLRDGS